MKIFLVIVFLFLNLYGGDLSDFDIIHMFFKHIYTEKNHNTNEKEFYWDPAYFSRNLPKSITKEYKSHYKVSIFYKFVSKDKKRINFLFTAKYDYCHSCSPLVLAGSISVKNHQKIVPLTYLLSSGTFGDFPKNIKILDMSKNFDTLAVNSVFTAQGIYTYNTSIIGFFKNNITVLLNIIKQNQIQDCKFRNIKKYSDIKPILQYLMSQMKKIVKNSLDNIKSKENGDFLSSTNHFCNIFIIKNNKTPEIYLEYTSFKKNKIDHISKIYNSEKHFILSTTHSR